MYSSTRRYFTLHSVFTRRQDRLLHGLIVEYLLHSPAIVAQIIIWETMWRVCLFTRLETHSSLGKRQVALIFTTRVMVAGFVKE